MIKYTGDHAYQDHDREFFERELASFVPDKVFDCHAHLWRGDAYAAPLPPGFPADMGSDDYLRLTGEVFPNRTLGAWFLPKPIVKHREQTLSVSEWVGQSLAGKPTCRGAFLVKPEDDPEWVREHARRLGLRGLKCYHTFSLRKPTLNAEIPEYLPEAVMQVAHEEGWYVTLHMVKDRAVADPGNQHWIRTYCERYPDMKLILAHSARGFQPSHNFEGCRSSPTCRTCTSTPAPTANRWRTWRSCASSATTGSCSAPTSVPPATVTAATPRSPTPSSGSTTTRRSGKRSTPRSSRSPSSWSTCAR